MGCSGSVNLYFFILMVRSICSSWVELVVGGLLVVGVSLGRVVDGWVGGGGGSRGFVMWSLFIVVGFGRVICFTSGSVDTVRGCGLVYRVWVGMLIITLFSG